MTKRDYRSNRNTDSIVPLGEHYQDITDKSIAPKILPPFPKKYKTIAKSVKTPLFDMKKEFGFLDLDKKQKPKIYYKHKMFTDGGCIPGTMDSAIGIVVYGEHGQVVIKHSERIGKATCNIAEYIAVYTGLILLKNQGILEVNISSDSKLIVNQINGSWKCIDPNMTKLCEKVKSLLKEFEWTLSWIPREQNRLADSLVNQAFRERSK